MNEVMDPTNPVIKLCMAGIRAEFEGRARAAHNLYQQAWDTSKDDYEACIAAHYLARFQETPEERLRWNQEAFERANRVNDESVKEFYPSLYLNLGRSHEVLGNLAEAQRYYDLAAQLGVKHRVD
jgi:tetratricopeptide (TPR) repeat protein